VFNLKSFYKPTGDQPKAIEQLVSGLEAGVNEQVLLGVTGSGKTFVMANLIQKLQRPTLVISHNKTLAAQLASEFREFFPENAVCYFVSYYDYYQPEAYIPKTDMYIEKDSDINEEIEKYRNYATQMLLTRRDVVVVASVSCIYGLGDPQNYADLSRTLKVNQSYRREKLSLHLTTLQYTRTGMSLSRGQFRVRGDTVEVFPTSEDKIIRIEFNQDIIERLSIIDFVTGEVLEAPKEITIFPATQFVAPEEKLVGMTDKIEAELKARIEFFKKKGKLLEAERIEQRTRFDLEMLREVGYCKGVENYSRYVDGRERGTHPSTLLDYFPDDYLMVIDESHITVPQIRGMYNGDRARKQVLVDYGFRLPSAMDNRPLQFDEFMKNVNQVVYTSATPNDWEKKRSDMAAKMVVQQSDSLKNGYPEDGVIEQVIRPTGLLDPEIEVRPITGQISDLISEISKRTEKGQRVLVTTMTKKMSEDLTDYLKEKKVKVQYLHSDVETIERTEILRDLRLGKYDVVVGINLLREGLDLPEVSLVAILDADKEGFLRSDTALIQTMGRAARHVEGKVIMYADSITGSMKRAIDETNRRRTIQEAYNQEHGITPQSIHKEIKEQLIRTAEAEKERKVEIDREVEIDENVLVVNDKPIDTKALTAKAKKRLILMLSEKMELAAQNLEFEKAAVIRDKIKEIKD